MTPVAEMHIVTAADADFGETAALVNAAFAVHPVLSGPRTSAEELAQEAGPDGEFLHEREDGNLVASALIRDGARYFDDLGRADALYFGLAAVSPARMRRGTGRRLVAEAERLARDRGYGRVLLSTLREFGLIDYYEAQGYQVINQQQFEAGHWSVTVPHLYVEMEKRLPGAEETV